ncbi:MAG: hypothetical protein M1827_000259 [Pycnora praestabilis]|nr:MAG: hypothetical protein M1827_000259 [Pycnora praestabilis]
MSTQSPDTLPSAASLLPKSLNIAQQNRFTSGEVDQFFEQAQASRPSFVYGSLMFPSAINTITQEASLLSVAKSMTPAILTAYQRYAVDGASYPAILPSDHADASVNGFLIFGLTREGKAAIDNFEGGLYDLTKVTVRVTLADGKTREIEAEAYVWRGYRDDLVEISQGEWTLEAFMGSSFYNWFSSNTEDEEAAL